MVNSSDQKQLTATPDPDTATVTYQWERQVGGEGAGVATSNTYTIAESVEAGDRIRVIATGTGSYAGTVTRAEKQKVRGRFLTCVE